MPFTLAHPMFAYPVKYVRPTLFSMTGLILGSMAPDFEYFLMLEPHRTIGHTWAGLFLQAIPLSILFALVFHHIVKRSLAVHLPSLGRLQLDQRAVQLTGPWRLGTFRSWVVFLISVAIGFVSHIALDECTHAGGAVVTRVPLLEYEWIAGLPVYKLLQYGLSLVGVLFLGSVAAIRLLRVRPASAAPRVSARQKTAYWTMVMLLTALLPALKIALSSSSNTIGILVVAPITGFALGLTAASVIFGTGHVSTPRDRAVQP